MGGIDFVSYAPFLIIAVSILVFINLWRIYKLRQDWQQISLMTACFSFTALYTWILIENPAIESARFGLRVVLSFSLAICWHVSYSYLKKFKRNGVDM